MDSDLKNIFLYNSAITRSMRNALLHQKSHLFWFTGLSGAGKSTIAHALEEKMHNNGHLTYVLDGDNIRHGLCRDLNFLPSDRTENIRRISELSKILLDAGLICFAAFISPTISDRTLVKEIVGETNFSEIFISCPLEICEQRDVKGNYKKARAGIIKNYTGISSPYEEPVNPALILETNKFSLDACVNKVLCYAQSILAL